MKVEQYIGGSIAFFDGFDGFNPHDIDMVEFNPSIPCAMVTINKGDTTIFRWKYDKAEDIINFLLKYPTPTHRVCLLLVPNIAKRIGMSIELLPKLRPLIDALDKRHEYLRVVYDSYIKDGKFRLTKAQREKAFKLYLKARE